MRSEAVNREIVVVAQIESARAIAALDSISSVPGLDAMMIGPYDLSASLGVSGQFQHPEYLRALAEYESIGRRRGIPLGTHIVQPDREGLREKIAAGYRFLAYGIDSVFIANAAINPLNGG